MNRYSKAARSSAMAWCVAVAAALMTAVAGTAQAHVYTVTPGGAKLSSFVNTLEPGDIVNVEPGTYHDVMKITANGTAAAPIIIRGVDGVGGTKPVFDATGLSVSGVGNTPRAIFQVQGAHITLENLELTGARNGVGNGSGIRMLNSTDAVIKDIKVDHNDMGIMGGDTDRLLITGCNIGFNGTTNGPYGIAHNLYMDGQGAIVLVGNYIHDAIHGQNFKSRAHYNELWYNWIADSNEGEVCAVNRSPDTSAPDSNLLMVGNTVISGPNRTGNQVKFINYGEDNASLGAVNGTAYIYNNTFVAGSKYIGFIMLTNLSGNSHLKAVAKDNIFYGSDHIVQHLTPAGAVTGSNNWMPTGADAAPGVFTHTIFGTHPGFVNPANHDYALLPGSSAVNQGTADLYYIDGHGVKHSVKAEYSYLLGKGLIPRPSVGLPDLGAYEVPEPATVGLLGVGAALLGGRRRRAR